MIKTHRVDSSTIGSVGYDKEKQELHVAFHGTGNYVYQNVTEDKYRDFLNAESKGKFLHTEIKGNHDYSKTGKR